MSTQIAQTGKKKALTPKLRFKEFNENWAQVRFTDCCDLIHGFQFRDEHFSETGLPVIKIGNLIDDGGISFKNITYVPENLKEQFLKFVLYKGDILMALTGGTLGKVSKVDKDYGVVFQNYRVGKFVAKENSTNDYVYFILQSDPVQSRVKSLVNEAAQPNFGKQDFDKIHIGLPILPEQQKIASFLSAVDEKIQQLTRKKELLEQYKKGVMQQLFTSSELGLEGLKDDRIGADENNPSIQKSRKSRFRQDNGKPYPKWEEKRLENICSFFSGGTPKSTNKKYYSGEIPFIGSGNIYDAEVTTFISQEALEDSSAKLVEKGDLLFALYGANSGEVAISKISGAINQAILCIRTKEDTNYLYNLLLYNQGRIVSKYLQGGQGNLSAEIVRKLKYKFPSLEEQQKIASFLTALDAKIESVAAQMEGTKNFKKGLLQQMFV